MTKVEERIEGNIQNDSVLMQFLGVDNVERLKTEITNAIIQQVIDDLKDSYDYIISPEDIVQDIVDEIMDNAKRTIQPKVEASLYKKAMAQLGLEEQY